MGLSFLLHAASMPLNLVAAHSARLATRPVGFRPSRWRPPLLQPKSPPAAALAAVPAGDAMADRPLRGRLESLLQPLSDPQANPKVLALCTAHMLSSVANLMQETYMPIYLSEVLKLSNTQIGNLQGMSHFLARLTSSLCGTLADFLSPPRMVILGTLLNAVGKPMLALSGTVHTLLGAAACQYWIAFAKTFERTAEAPAKALIGELAARCSESPAAAFSLRHAMATLGMLLGSSAAWLAFELSGRNYLLTFLMAAVPASLALALLAVAFGGSSGAEREVEPPAAATTKRISAGALIRQAPPGDLLAKARALAECLQPGYWQGLIVVCTLFFARFDVSFIILRAKAVMDKALLPALLPTMMLSTVVLAPSCGLRAKASTRARNNVMLLGMAALLAADMCFVFATSTPGILLGAVLVGSHMAMIQGVAQAMLSSYIPSNGVSGLGRVSGTAWSFTDILLGFVLAGSNSLAGRLCDFSLARGWGNTGCFMGGACTCALAMLALLGFSTFGSLGREGLEPKQTA